MFLKIWICLLLVAIQLHLQASAQYYRPYNNYRRPVYATERPVYASAQYYRPYNYNRRPVYATQRPVYATRRPVVAAAPMSSVNRPTISRPVTNSCSSTETEICWDSSNQLLRTGPNLTIEKFVAFYAKNWDGSDINTFDPKYRNQICEQSRRFNNVGVMCVSTGEDDCQLNGAATAQQCYNLDCTCVVGQRYQQIAQQHKKPFDNNSFPAWFGIDPQIANSFPFV